LECSHYNQDWYDGWIEEAEDMNTYVISDPHFNHEKLATHLKQRPLDFSEKVERNWKQTVKENDLIICLGDFLIGPKRQAKDILTRLPGIKWLIRGNHDRDKSCGWWVEQGFQACMDSFVMRNILFTHEPANAVIKSNGNRPYDQYEWGLPLNCEINIHGHLHDVWHGFFDEKRMQRDQELLGIDFRKQLKHPWQRLFSLEYTDYRPVELNKFLAHPDRYQSTGPRKQNGNGDQVGPGSGSEATETAQG